MMTKGKTEEKVEQWAECYRSGTDGEIEAAIKILYKMESWHDLHVALWTWLSLDGKREKEEWFNKFDVPEVSNYCFACEQAEISFADRAARGYCYYCPLTDSTADDCLNGLYGKWHTANSEQREILAKEIATMKWEERI